MTTMVVMMAIRRFIEVHGRPSPVEFLPAEANPYEVNLRQDADTFHMSPLQKRAEFFFTAKKKRRYSLSQPSLPSFRWRVVSHSPVSLFTVLFREVPTHRIVHSAHKHMCTHTHTCAHTNTCTHTHTHVHTAQTHTHPRCHLRNTPTHMHVHITHIILSTYLHTNTCTYSIDMCQYRYIQYKHVQFCVNLGWRGQLEDSQGGRGGKGGWWSGDLIMYRKFYQTNTTIIWRSVSTSPDVVHIFTLL